MAVMTGLHWGFMMSDVGRHDGLNDNELLRYARQILLDDWDVDAQIRLKNSQVLIVGMGGLGCPVASILVRAGVGRVHLVDFDVVEISNLQRQMLFCTEDIGEPKAMIAAQKLQMHNPYVVVSYDITKITDDTIVTMMESLTPDLVIDCTDNFAVRDTVNRYCRQKGIALLSNSAIGEMGQIALFTQETGCYQCLFGDDDGDTQTCSSSGVLASTVHIIGSMTAQVALEFLGRNKNPIAGQLLLWQGRQMSLRQVLFTTNPSCHLCHQVP